MNITEETAIAAYRALTREVWRLQEIRSKADTDNDRHTWDVLIKKYQDAQSEVQSKLKGR